MEEYWRKPELTAETFAHGKTAIEIDPNGVAAQEIASLWSSIKEKI